MKTGIAMRWRILLLGLGTALFFSASAKADDTGTRLPVREVTVFKDGNAFVLREGAMPVTADNRVILTDLPNPILGTFWPYASQAGVTLRSVTAARHRTTVERSALNLREMLEANVGKRATIQEFSGDPYEARIVAVPHPDAPASDSNPPAEAAAPGPDNTSNLLLLQTDKGMKALGLDRVQEVTLLDSPKQTRTSAEWRNDLSLQLSGVHPGTTANVGVLYVQPGIRWIPNYKVNLDGKGNAKIQLQATLINELTDLDDATVNLVIGVPTFAFKDTPDPIGLQDTFAQLSRYFQVDARTPGAFANSIMAQSRAGESSYMRSAGATSGDSGSSPTVTEGEKAEDLFVFTLKNVHIKRNERMVVPVAEFSLPYKNVYAAELLPSSYRTRNGYEQISANNDALRALQQPHVQHKLRFTNSSPYPLTTAPTLVLREGRVVSQGMMSYTSRGGTSDLTLTEASDVSVKRTDVETKRTPESMRADDGIYARVDMAGTLELRNFRQEPVEIEVTRYILGAGDSADSNGVLSILDPFGDDVLPDWFAQYNIGDRLRFTGMGKITWTKTLPPGGDCQYLRYTWHYFIR